MSELVAHKADVTIPVYGTIADAEVYLKSEADKVIAEKDAEIARLNDKALQYKVLDKEHCRDLNTQERRFALQIAHHKYKRCMAMAHAEWLKQMVLCNYPESILYRSAARRERKWKEMAQNFKEAK